MSDLDRVCHYQVKVFDPKGKLKYIVKEETVRDCLKKTYTGSMIDFKPFRLRYQTKEPYVDDGGE